MPIMFSADEVFEMAEQIERNGAAFYRRAAELHVADADRTFLLDLAATEDLHEKTFAAMRADLPAKMRESTAADPYMETHMYLQEAANTHGGEGAPSVAAALTGDESMQDILRTAISLEEKSIVYYVRLKDMVSGRSQEKIDAIIGEEKQHVEALALHFMQLVKG